MQLLIFLYLMYAPLINKALVIAAVIIAAILIARYIEYRMSTYYRITKYPYFSVRFNLGRYGEYYTYKRLKCFEAEGAQFLFNVYIPKDNGETTEIDVLMLSHSGIFVLESKNYSGWIFGNEYQKNWCQTLPAGKRRSHKEFFYNPVMQNRSHIKHLTAFLERELPTHSIIAFSERCTLKNVEIKSPDIYVVNRNKIAPIVAAICAQTNSVLSDHEISDIFNKLYPLTQVDATTRAQHIANIHNKKQPHPAVATTPVVSIDVTYAQPPENAVFPESEELKCPKCGGKLILRTAQKGVNTGKQFYGCSNFPKCKYIQAAPREK